MNLDNYILLAKKQAELVRLYNKKNNRYRLGCVIFSGKKIISVGHNYYGKTHPKSERVNNGDKTNSICAELSAILSCTLEELKGARILVIRIMANGEMSMARPCSSCFNLIKNVGIKRIYFSNWRGEIETIHL